jgi:hypothetical protein
MFLIVLWFLIGVVFGYVLHSQIRITLRVVHPKINKMWSRIKESFKKKVKNESRHNK